MDFLNGRSNKYLSFSLKAVKELNNIWMLKASHNLNLPLETSQLLFRTPHLWHELQSYHLMDTQTVGAFN